MVARMFQANPWILCFYFQIYFYCFYHKCVLNISVLVKAFMYVQNQKTVGR